MSKETLGGFVCGLNPNEFFDYSGIQSYSKLTQTNSELIEEESQNKTAMNPSDYLVAFSTNTKNYCVGVVDMVDSTKISARIGSARISRYYQIFLNSMSKIISRFGGEVIKNVGDCLVYYFPDSSKEDYKFGLMSCLECSFAMIEAHDIICEKLKQEGLPTLDYRISLDYGAVVIMKSNVSESTDMIGPPVNMCSKINRCAEKNGIVLGGDLHERVKNFEEYSYRGIKGYSLGFKFPYPLYAVKRK